MVDAIGVLAVAAAGLLGVITATGWYLLRRLKNLERKDEVSEEQVKQERDRLQTRVTDLEAQVRDLKVKADRVDALQTQIEAMGRSLKETQERLDLSEERSNNLQHENERLVQRHAELQADLSRLETENAAYERAFQLLGQRLDDKSGSETPPEPAPEVSEKTDDTAKKEQDRGTD